MYDLSIVTPQTTVYENKVKSLIAPGGSGYLEILTNHAPILTTLLAGPLTVVDSEGVKVFFNITGGFMEVSKNKATILADAVEKPAG